MRVVDSLRRSGVGITPDRPVREAAAVMDRAGIGALAVVEWDRLVGIVTDRDLACRVLAPGLPDTTPVGRVMTSAVVSVDAAADVGEALAAVRTFGVRRLPVVSDGRFVGMITTDDLLVELVGSLADLVGPSTAATAGTS